MLILIDELKLLQQKHSQFLLRCREKLVTDKPIETILEHLRIRNGKEVTGNEMAQLLKLMRSGKIHTNKKEMEEVMTKHNTLINQMLAKLHK